MPEIPTLAGRYAIRFGGEPCGEERWRIERVPGGFVMTGEQVTTAPHPFPSRQPRRNFGPNLSNTNISYFVGLDANDTMPQMFLAGDRNIVDGTLLPNRILLLTTNDAVSWGKDLHKQQGNVALADGSVQGFSSSRLQAALMNTGSLTNRLAIP